MTESVFNVGDFAGNASTLRPRIQAGSALCAREKKSAKSKKVNSFDKSPRMFACAAHKNVKSVAVTTVFVVKLAFATYMR